MLTLMHTIEIEHKTIRNLLRISVFSIQSSDLKELIRNWSFKLRYNQILFNSSFTSQMYHLRSLERLFDKYIERSDTNLL